MIYIFPFCCPPFLTYFCFNTTNFFSVFLLNHSVHLRFCVVYLCPVLCVVFFSETLLSFLSHLWYIFFSLVCIWHSCLNFSFINLRFLYNDMFCQFVSLSVYPYYLFIFDFLMSVNCSICWLLCLCLSVHPQNGAFYSRPGVWSYREKADC